MPIMFNMRATMHSFFSVSTPDGNERLLRNVYLLEKGNAIGQDFILGDTRAKPELLAKAIQITFPTGVENGNRLFVLGGLLARGNKSIELIEAIMAARNKGLIIYTVLGSHEVMTLNLIQKLKSYFGMIISTDVLQRREKLLLTPTNKCITTHNVWILDLFLREVSAGKINLVKDRIEFEDSSLIQLISNFLTQCCYGVNVSGRFDVGAFRVRYVADANTAVPNKQDLAYEVFDSIQDEETTRGRDRNEESPLTYFGYYSKKGSNVNTKRNTVSLYCGEKISYVFLVNHQTKDIYRLGEVPITEADVELTALDTHLAQQSEREKRILGNFNNCLTLKDMDAALNKLSAHSKAESNVVYYRFAMYLINNNAFDRFGLNIKNFKDYEEALKPNVKNDERIKEWMGTPTKRDYLTTATDSLLTVANSPCKSPEKHVRFASPTRK